MNKSILWTLAFLASALALPTHGDHHEKNASLSIFQETLLDTYTGETDKLVQLIEAFPESGFEWRPAEGIRSVREAALHVASANYFLIGRLGGAVPEDLKPQDFEKNVLGKTETIRVLKRSIRDAMAAVRSLSEADLQEKIKLFGKESPKMKAALMLNVHASEHLGQLIAYARSSGVTPPWSQ